MREQSLSRWTSVGRASAAVAGVCLTGSVASAWTTTRAAEFETEFEAGTALAAARAASVACDAAAVTAAAVTPAARVLAAETGPTLWEQTLVGYLDKLVARDCAECGGSPAAKDKETVARTQSAPNPDWDLEEPASPAAVDTDWDLEDYTAPMAKIEAPQAQPAKADVDWDLAEPAAVAVKADPEWDLEEPAVTVAATPANPDWDIDEPAANEAATAAAREAAGAKPTASADANPDWDIEEPALDVAPVEAVTKTDPDEADFDLFFLP